MNPIFTVACKFCDAEFEIDLDRQNDCPNCLETFHWTEATYPDVTEEIDDSLWPDEELMYHNRGDEE